MNPTKWKAQSNSHIRLILQGYKYTKEIPLLTDSTAKEAEQQLRIQNKQLGIHPNFSKKHKIRKRKKFGAPVENCTAKNERST